MKLPIFIDNSRIPDWLSKFLPIKIKAVAFFIFVFSKGIPDDHTKQHEVIHFKQQIELLFIFQWILYGIFFLIGCIKYRSFRRAYATTPFELEATSNQANHGYLKRRKFWGWIKYIKWQ